MTTIYKNLRTNNTVENGMTKIWVAVTGQPITREIVDALMAFKNQQEGWGHVAVLLDTYLNERETALGGHDGVLKMLLTNSGVTYTPAQFTTIATSYVGKSPLEMLISLLIDPANLQAATLASHTINDLVVPLLASINTVPTGKVSIDGNASVGATLTASNTLSDIDGLGAISYQWFSNGAAISGATTPNLSLNSGLLGTAISVKASYIDGLGNGEAIVSAASAAVVAAQKVGSYGPVSQVAVNPFTGVSQIVDLRPFKTTEQFAAARAESNTSTGNHVYSFDGKAVFNSSMTMLTTLPIKHFAGISSPYDPIVDAQEYCVLDFGGGAHHVVIDLSAKNISTPWMIFKDFGADDTITYTFSAQGGTRAGTGNNLSTVGQKFLTVNRPTSFEEMRTMGASNLAQTINPKDITASVMFLKDSVVSFSDQATRFVTNFPNNTYINPENAPIEAVGLLAFDIYNLEKIPFASDTQPYRFAGYGADGTPDMFIAFVGTVPNLSPSIEFTFHP